MRYDHLGYIATAYALFAAATLYLGAGAQVRLAAVSKRLKAIDQRGRK